MLPPPAAQRPPPRLTARQAQGHRGLSGRHQCPQDGRRLPGRGQHLRQLRRGHAEKVRGAAGEEVDQRRPPAEEGRCALACPPTPTSPAYALSCRCWNSSSATRASRANSTRPHRPLSSAATRTPPAGCPGPPRATRCSRIAPP